MTLIKEIKDYVKNRGYVSDVVTIVPVEGKSQFTLVVYKYDTGKDRFRERFFADTLEELYDQIKQRIG
jgi:hypothetical protein